MAKNRVVIAFIKENPQITDAAKGNKVCAKQVARTMMEDNALTPSKAAKTVKESMQLA